MDIREFVSYLHVSKGPDGNEEYLCRCPAHDDRQEIGRAHSELQSHA